MTAININLDEKFKFNPERTVIIGGKEHHLLFTDSLEEKLQNLQITMLSTMDEVSKSENDFVEKMSVKERKIFLRTKLAKVLDQLKGALDDVLGEGEGQRLYEYYQNSSYALGQVANALIKINDEVNSEKSTNARNKKRAVRNYYAKKKRK